MFLKRRRGKLKVFVAACLGAAFFLAPSEGATQKPLHQRIDAIIDGARTGPPAEICSDGEFVRRAYLNLVGVIPTAEEARRFIDDDAPDKRTTLIDRLLADERFAHHMRIVFDAMLMERRPAKHIKNGAWRAYLLHSFRNDKPLNALAREILSADPDGDVPAAAARFYLDREVQPHLLTRDVGRLMLGRDLQCAQCHDHPVIGDYEQSEYYGIYAFINRSYLFTDKKKKQTLLAEKAEGEVSYESVFDKGTEYHADPQLPGRAAIDEPDLPKEELYKVQPPKGGRGVPAYSRRKELAERLTGGDYERFNRNMANRLWAVMFGRGIVHPLDLHHDHNPPAHPELLKLLGEELAATQFDVRGFLRQIALSNAYQRSCCLPKVSAMSHSDVETALAHRKTQRQQHLGAAQAARDEARTLAGRIADINLAVADAESAIEEAAAALKSAEEKFAASAAQLERARQEFEMKEAAITTARDQFAAVQPAAAGKPDNPPDSGDIAQLKKSVKEAEAAAAESQKNFKAQQAIHQRTIQERAAAQAALAEGKSAQTAAKKRAQNIESLQQQLQQAREKMETAETNAQMAEAAVEDARALLALVSASDATSAAEARSALRRRWSERFYVYGLQPLSPEQMALSLHQAVGDFPARLEAARKSAHDALEKESKKSDSGGKSKSGQRGQNKRDESTADATLEVQRRAHRAVYEQLQGVMDELVDVFAQTDGQPTRDYQGRAKEALYLANSPLVNGLVGGRLAKQLAAMEKRAALAEELYLAVLSRRPRPPEADAVAEFLRDRDKDRQAAVEEMIWGLLSSNEFRFNH